MGIMHFESWQAVGFGVPVLGRRGRREEALLALPGSSVWKASPKVQEAKIGPFCLSVIGFNYMWSLLNMYCVQSTVLGAAGHSGINKDGSPRPQIQ